MKYFLIITILLFPVIAKGNCLDLYWSPQANQYCTGELFEQKSNCGVVKLVVGTASVSGCITNKPKGNGIDSGWFPDDQNIARIHQASPTVIGRFELGDYRASEGGDHTFPVKITSQLSYDIPLFLKTKKEFENFLEKKAANSYNNSPRADDEIRFCLVSDYSPTLSSWSDEGVRATSCGAHSIRQTRTCSFNIQGTDFPICDNCDNVTLTQNDSYTVTSNGIWSPSSDSYCPNIQVRQTDSCGMERFVGGTKNCPSACTPNWAPSLSSFCDDRQVYQTDACGNSRSLLGQKDCGPPACVDEPFPSNSLVATVLVVPGWQYIGFTPPAELPVGTGASRLNYRSLCGNVDAVMFECRNNTIGQFGCRAGDR